MKAIILPLAALLLAIAGCNHIETHRTLSAGDIRRLHAMGLLNDGEQVERFYSEWRKSVAGNFYTNQRLASYWIDDKPERNQRHSAFFKDVIALDSVYHPGLTWAPYLLVTAKDSTRFKVCVDGKPAEVRAFFEGAFRRWHAAHPVPNRKPQTPESQNPRTLEPTILKP